jgi:murein DD-endopeptidase MepM/ murein hydrolase activator NlpD
MRFRRVVVAVLAAAWLGMVGAPTPAGGVESVVAGAAGPTSAGWAGRLASGSAGTWEWPLPEHTLAAPYAAPATRYAAGHRGVDFPAAAGAAVRAPDDAVVRFSGVVVDRPVLTLDHGNGVLSSFEPLVSELPAGSVVARGAVLGAVGSGGHCGTGCLHVGVRVDGEYVSPMLFFARVPPAVLLPLGGG